MSRRCWTPFATPTRSSSAAKPRSRKRSSPPGVTRVVARAGVGVDNIDLTAATRAGVLVLNAPGANAVSAAEHTIALLLAVTRQMVPADVSTGPGSGPARRCVR